MGYELDAHGLRRLGTFFSSIGDVLNNKKRRESYAIYAMGLLGSAARKSAEPLAAAASGDPKRCSAAHQRMTHFLADSPWNDSDLAPDEATRGVLRDDLERRFIGAPAVLFAALRATWP